MRRILVLTVAVLTSGSWAYAADAAGASKALAQTYPGVQLYYRNGELSRVYGVPFGFGSSVEESADGVVASYSALFGVAPADLAPASPVTGLYTQPLMFDPAIGDYKFVLAHYAQYKDGLPVYRTDTPADGTGAIWHADLRLLMRNEPGYPLVLAASSLRDLGDFVPVVPPTVAEPAAHAAAADLVPGLVSFTPARLVIWAGAEMPPNPTLAIVFEGDNGQPASPAYQKWRFAADAAAGRIVGRENLICNTDVVGSVHGLATPIPKAAQCTPQVDTPLPYARVSIDTTVAYADAAGNFTIPNAGAAPVTVNSGLRGAWFRVFNQAGADTVLSQTVTPPGPANFLHNSANNSEFNRAEVDAYLQSNVVRDFALVQNPTYPTIYNQPEFTANVNIADTCNAYYDGGSINFFKIGGGCSNTAFSSVVHHEYGHHLVQTGGSGQGQYGEGMADCVAVLIADDPILAYGFYYNNCNSGIRNAANTMQYPCQGEVHNCGMVLSGCVWSTRNQLKITNPNTYLPILSRLTVNSILLHSGDLIAPDITIDFLTLDDDDHNLGNGTPHYNEICAGFGAHNMACPPLTVGLQVAPGAGLSSAGDPGGPFSPSSIDYTLKNIGPDPFDYAVTKTAPWISLTNASGTLAGGATTTVTVALNGAANDLPVGVYSDTVQFTNTTSHQGDTQRAVTVEVGGPKPIYSWNMDTDPGWTTEGQWAWGQPTGGGGEHGFPDPTSGHTGTHVYGYNLNGDYANNMPAYNLITTPIDVHDLTQTSVRFWRWLGVDQVSHDRASIWVSGNGDIWTQAWKNGDTAITDNAWVYQQFPVPSGTPTLYVRWTMGPTDASGRYCGWNIDDVEIWGVRPPVLHPGDMNCDGVVNFADIDGFVLALSGQAAYLAQYPDCQWLNADLNGDGHVTFDDVDPFVDLLTH